MSQERQGPTTVWGPCPSSIRRLLWISAALSSLAFVQGCAPPVYWGKEIAGTVVEADTGKPLQGAVVVAVWAYKYVFFNESLAPGMDQVETETDIDGRFRFAAWGPRLRRPLLRLGHRAPELLVVKRGYLPRLFSNGKPHFWSSTRDSEWNGMALGLEPVSNNREEQLRRLGIVLGGLSNNLPFPQRFLDELIGYEADTGPDAWFDHVRKLKKLKQFRPKG